MTFVIYLSASGPTFLESLCQEYTAHLKIVLDYSRISGRRKLLACIGGELCVKHVDYILDIPLAEPGCLRLKMF